MPTDEPRALPWADLNQAFGLTFVAARTQPRALPFTPRIIRGNPTSCVELINRVFENDGRYATVAVVQTNGEIFAMRPPASAPLNPSEQRFVQRVIETRDFVVGDFPANRTGNSPVLNFGFPVF